MHIILASGSPRRKELLSKIVDEFDVIPSHVEEIVPEKIQVPARAAYLADLKARDVAKEHAQKDTLVIGSDTIVVLDGEMMGKPVDSEDAKNMLRALSGRTHTVYTGCALYLDGKAECCFTEKTDVTFYPLTENEIEDYVASGDPMDKAGAYGIQSGAVLFVQSIHGDYNTVIGLPAARLSHEIHDLEKRHARPKQGVALTPPMGWNSWDVYGAGVTESELMRNAQFTARHLKAYGWEYIVCDIEWYEPKAEGLEYRPYAPLVMDEFGRLLPAVNRFPSAAGPKTGLDPDHPEGMVRDQLGFKPIADQIHAMGLKFGIHILRGIPRQAVYANTPIMGTPFHAADIVKPGSYCTWNMDMYGIDAQKPGAQAYYDSIFALYASWGVDYVKVDDIASLRCTPDDPYSASGEVELIHEAIRRCGREMVLSLSPGPAVVDRHEHLRKHANMWRMTDDFWDDWNALFAMFERCHVWEDYVGLENDTGRSWPDCDMLPIGRISLRNDPRKTRLTYDEQQTMMSLWCIFRSPLMIGSELPDADEETIALLTCQEILDLNQHGSNPHQIDRDGKTTIWECLDADGRKTYGLFNLSDKPRRMRLDQTRTTEAFTLVHNLWTGEDTEAWHHDFEVEVPVHGCVVVKIS